VKKTSRRSICRSTVADKLKEGAIDAFFNVSGCRRARCRSCGDVGIELVPIAAAADKLLPATASSGAEENPDHAYQEASPAVKTSASMRVG